MRFVHDHRVALAGGVDGHAFAPGLQRRQRLADERELLNGRDDDRRAARQGLGELLRVLVDLLDHALLMLELVDRVLKLLVEHPAVGDHHDGVENLLVVIVVQARQAVGQPGDGIRLAGPGRVLDQVVAPRSVRPGVADQGSDGVKLVVARKDHRLLPHRPDTLVRVDLPLLDLQVHEALEDVEQAVGLEHLVPQVVGLPVVRDRRIAGAEAVAPVEGKEDRLLALQPRGHPHLVRVHGEMHQRPLLEGEQQIALVPVGHVLGLGVRRPLARLWVFQLRRHHGDAVNGKGHVDNATAIGAVRLLHHRGEGDLARGRQPVLGVTLGGLRVHARVRAEKG